MHPIIKQLITDLRALQLSTLYKDNRNVKRHAHALLTQLQQLNPQDND